jgi:hypothetical protein
MQHVSSVVVAFAGLGALALGAGCSTVNTARGWFLKGNVLTYEQYLSIDPAATPTPTADTVLQQLGMPLSVKDRDGVRRRIDYHAYSLTGDLKNAEFSFDENEKLVKKDLW